ncbi:MAG: aminotransferase class I/II-fold pyridoxal phosphate-dependent enzyme [Spirochaetales bacterium]|nr:MAG: aminotransferase class I/II-fold pyridoxal phosphate-dependent enzyme [Spirochaetales bacterium]
MNALAEELNRILADTCAGRLLSDSGARMYFPKGILSQSAEATEKAHRFNATIGMAFDHGEPMVLDAVKAHLPLLSRREAVAYAPTAGVNALREAWRSELLKKNPSLAKLKFSLPVVVPGLTAGISYLADLFVSAGDPVVVADMFWPNYRLIMEERKGARLSSYPFFNGAGGFNVDGLEAAARRAAEGRGKAVVILNYPNNPTGYTPTLVEADAIKAALIRVAESGIDLLVVSDDAYFGLQYEEGILRESLFARFADAHPRILAAKVDGPTKEDYVWGFRGGFVTFASVGMDDHTYNALVRKLMGVIRSSISNSAAPTQYILLKAMTDPGFEVQKAQFRAILEGRYKRVKKFLAANTWPTGFLPLPFNSGYFMCFQCQGFSAEALRLKLLEEQGIGTISIQDTWLRVAFSSVEEDEVDELFTMIFEAAQSMTGS